MIKDCCKSILGFFPHSTDSYIEVLDGSRVHPETYEWARKMAVDALEYDESAEDANPAGALEEILENPERLKDLDLDAFAEELERQVCVCCDNVSFIVLCPHVKFNYFSCSFYLVLVGLWQQGNYSVRYSCRVELQIQRPESCLQSPQH